MTFQVRFKPFYSTECIWMCLQKWWLFYLGLNVITLFTTGIYWHKPPGFQSSTHGNGVKWMLRHLKSTAALLVVQKPVLTNNKDKIKALHHLLILRGIHWTHGWGNLWMDSPHKGSVIGKGFSDNKIIKSEAAPELLTQNILSGSVIRINVSKHLTRRRITLFPTTMQSVQCKWKLSLLQTWIKCSHQATWLMNCW